MLPRDTPERLLRSSYPLAIRARTLVSDMDAFRHLNNGAIARYLQEGRASLNQQLFGVGTLNAAAEREAMQAAR